MTRALEAARCAIAMLGIVGACAGGSGAGAVPPAATTASSPTQPAAPVRGVGLGGIARTLDDGSPPLALASASRRPQAPTRPRQRRLPPAAAHDHPARRRRARRRRRRFRAGRSPGGPEALRSCPARARPPPSGSRACAREGRRTTRLRGGQGQRRGRGRGGRARATRQGVPQLRTRLRGAGPRPAAARRCPGLHRRPAQGNASSCRTSPRPTRSSGVAPPGDGPRDRRREGAGAGRGAGSRERRAARQPRDGADDGRPNAGGHRRVRDARAHRRRRRARPLRSRDGAARDAGPGARPSRAAARRAARTRNARRSTRTSATRCSSPGSWIAPLRSTARPCASIPKLVSAWINLATALARNPRTRKEARADLERARALSPDDPRVKANLEELDALEKGPSRADAGASP